MRPSIRLKIKSSNVYRTMSTPECGLSGHQMGPLFTWQYFLGTGCRFPPPASFFLVEKLTYSYSHFTFSVRFFSVVLEHVTNSHQEFTATIIISITFLIILKALILTFVEFSSKEEDDLIFTREMFSRSMSLDQGRIKTNCMVERKTND